MSICSGVVEGVGLVDGSVVGSVVGVACWLSWFGVVVGVGVSVGVGVVVSVGAGVAVGSGVVVVDGVGVGDVVPVDGKTFCSCRYCCVIVPPAVGVKLGAPVCSLKMPMSRNQWTIQFIPHSLKIFSSFASACCS